MTHDCRSGRMVLRTAAAAALVLLPTGALSAQGQTPPDSTGAIRGRVSSEAGGEPVEDARVHVELADGARVLRTDSAGEFRAGPIPPGARPIEITAEGFERKRVTARVPPGGTLRLELRLTPAPRQTRRPKTVGRVVTSDGSPLSGVAVRADGTYLSTVTGSEGGFEMELPNGVDRLRFSRIGYRTHTVDVPSAVATGSDTLRVTLVPRPVELKGITVEGRRLEGGEARTLGHTVTTETVRQAPAVGEPDLFRALVYLPEVSQPNDVKGRIHLAGGSSDETGYRLDGHPLQQPFHLLGLMGAFNVAALERADIRIHRFPISDGGRLSGLVDMSTRRASDEPHSESVGSILSSSFTTARPEMPGDLDLLASGRVTYLDRIVPSLTETDDYPQVGYYDGLLRLGRTWQPGWRAELLGFRTGNYFRFDDITREEQEPLNWGESLLGARLERQTGDWRITLRGSFNRAFTGLDERPVDPEYVDATRDWWSAEGRIERRDDDWRFLAGAAVDHRRHRQSWDARSLAEDVFSPHVPGTYSGTSQLTVLAGFAEASLDLTDVFSTTGGTRLVRTAEGLFAAPRVLLSYEAGDELTVETSLGRRLQFDAEIEEPDAWSTMPPRFLLDSPRTADVLASALRWTPGQLPLIGTEGRVRLTGFWKRYPDRPILVGRQPLAPTGREQPQYSDFPSFRRVQGRSAGFSVEARFRVGEDGLFQGSYAYQRVQEKVKGEWSPASWDLPHSLSLFTSLPIFADLTGNVAFRAHSGPPVTPVEARLFVPTRGFGNAVFENRVLGGERNSLRLDGYARLDLGLRHRFDGFGADWVLFGQVLNLFWARNPVGVDWDERVKYDVFGKDGIEDGLPVVPSFGVEVKW